MSAPAVGLLKELYTVVGNPYLFIGPKKVATLSVTALVAALRRVGRNQTAHESWATFVTTAPVEERKGDVVPMRGPLTCGDQASAAGIGPRPSR